MEPRHADRICFRPKGQPWKYDEVIREAPELGMTQEQVAMRSGDFDAAVNKWERGAGYPISR